MSTVADNTVPASDLDSKGSVVASGQSNKKGVIFYFLRQFMVIK